MQSPKSIKIWIIWLQADAPDVVGFHVFHIRVEPVHRYGFLNAPGFRDLNVIYIDPLEPFDSP